MGTDLKRCLSLRTVGRMCYADVNRLDFGSDEFYTLIYCDGEPFALKLADKTIRLKTREVVVTDRGTKFSIVSDGTNDSGGVRAFVAEISLKSSFAIDFFVPSALSVFGQDLLAFALKTAGSLFGDTSAFVERLPRAGYSPADVQSFRSALELVVITAFAPKSRTERAYDELLSDKSSSAQTAARIYEFLQANVDKKLTLQDVADATFFSVSYVKQAFLRHANKPVMAAFEEMKIERAKELLRAGKNVEETARAVGYENPMYFTRVFKKNTGLTPTKFKSSIDN